MGENDRNLARMWPAYVRLERRLRTELPFLLTHITPTDAVFNAALGSGATTIGLYRTGVKDIVSNEIDPAFVEVAREEAARHGVLLVLTSYDWREIPDTLARRFDAVVNIGNSLTYLFGHDERVQALRNFRMMLRPGGKLIVDERNYAHHFLADPTGARFVWSGDVVYCGKGDIDVRPVRISDEEVVLRYDDLASGERAFLRVYPFKEGELEKEIGEAGFSRVRRYGDYRETFEPAEPEFLTYVCTR